MGRRSKIIVSVLVVLVLAVGGFFIFEYVDHRGKVADAGRTCGSLLTPTAGVALPSGLPFTLPAGQTLLDVTTQGRTSAVTVSVKGGRQDLVSLRDRAVADLQAQGYAASATDQEPTYEAEGAFSGKVPGTINVQPLCTGYDKIRYKFNQ